MMAKLRADQVQASLEKSLAPVYLVSGDEPLLVQEACQQIRTRAKAEGFSERELLHTDGGFSWDSLHYLASSMSLFADKKVIEIRVHNGKPGDLGSKALVQYCSAPSKDKLLLLVFPKIDKRTHNSKWYKAVEQAGATVALWPISSHQLPRWLSQRIQSAGLKVDAQAIDILSAKVEGNLLAAVQEIEKLKLLGEGVHIDAQLMADSVMESSRYDVFGLCDAALSGSSAQTMKILQTLKNEGTPAAVVLWSLSREVRTLAGIQDALAIGEHFDQCARKHGIWDNRKAMVKAALKRLNKGQMQRLLRLLVLADKAIKGAVKDNPWDVLLDLALSLSGVDALTAKTQKLLLNLG